MLRSLRALLAGLFILTAAASPLLADEAGTVHQVVIQGNQRIEQDTIRSYLSLAPGDSFNDAKIDKSLKSLFATGLFADVTIHRDNDDLVVVVAENPIINRIAFEGNSKVKTEDLEKEVQLKPRTVFTRTKVQADLKRLQDIYRRNGRFGAAIEPKVIELPQNRVDLVFEIKEGEPTYVTRIDFVGNHHFSDSALKDVLQTREERWYRFFSSDDTYDPDRLAYDRELLRRFYLKNGYADFRVVSSVAELSPDRSKFFITYTLEEGERYKLDKVSVKSALRDLKSEQLQSLIADMEAGDWYDAEKVDKVVQAMTDAAGNLGYAFVEIRPVVTRHRETKTLDIVFEIGEAPRIYVERIDITGNVRTLDKVIRREFRLVEGDAFNTAKFRLSQQRLKDLDFFEKVDVTNVPSPTAPDRTDIKVDVTEKSTGDLSVGVGWSSAIGPLFNVGAAERNLLGTGQSVSVNTQIAALQTLVNFSYTDPYFLDRRIAAGFDIFASATDPYAYLDYAEGTHGIDFRASYFYNENLAHTWKYTLSSTNIHDISTGASPYIWQEAGVTILSEISHTLIYDRRDSKIDPTSGYYVRYGNDFAGLGGNDYFIRSSFGAGHYFSLADQTVLLLSTTEGYIQGIGGHIVPIQERYFLGGDTLRGFKYYGVSPRDSVTNDVVGGSWDATATAEVKFPLGLPKELGMQGKLFTDIGSIGPLPNNAKLPNTTLEETTEPRLSVGTGVIWKSPMGPIDVDIGVPVIRQPHDNIQFFLLNFGTRI